MGKREVSDATAVRDMYAASAASYSEMMDEEIANPLYGRSLTRLQANIADLAGTLVDTACGPGHMLALYHREYDPARALFGIDLSPQMLKIATQRLGAAASLASGDMRHLEMLESGTAAAVINFFALHHLDAAGISDALQEWYRVLRQDGLLSIAAWEGEGTMDYGGGTDLVAAKHGLDDLETTISAHGFTIASAIVEWDAAMQMNIAYLECVKE